MSRSYSREIRSFSKTVDNLIKSTSRREESSPSRKERIRKSSRRSRSRERESSRSRNRGRGKKPGPSKKERNRNSSRRSRSRERESNRSRSRGRGRAPNPSKKGSSKLPRRIRSQEGESNKSRSRGRARSPSKMETQKSSHRSSIEQRHSSQNPRGSQNQARITPALLPQDEQILEQNGIDTKLLSLQAAEELSKRPKNGEIYDEVVASVKSIEKRLKYLSECGEMFSIDAAIEIADAAYLLRLLRKPNHEIEIAGQMAHRGALLMLQADMLFKKGQELLEQSKRQLKFTAL